MLGHAGFSTALPKSALSGMIDVVKGVEPETGYGAILRLPDHILPGILGPSGRE
jgi:formate dehydrogenase major subunit